MDAVIPPAPSLFPGPGIAPGVKDLTLKQTVDHLWAGVGEEVSPSVVPPTIGATPIVGDGEPVYTKGASIDTLQQFRVLFDATAPPADRAAKIGKSTLAMAGIVPSSVYPAGVPRSCGTTKGGGAGGMVGTGSRRRMPARPVAVPPGAAMGISVATGASDF